MHKILELEKRDRRIMIPIVKAALLDVDENLVANFRGPQVRYAFRIGLYIPQEVQSHLGKILIRYKCELV